MTAETNRTRQESLNALHSILSDRFDLNDLKVLCFQLGVDFDALPGDGKPVKATGLLSYLERRQRLHELLETGRRLRSDITWPDAPGESDKTAIRDMRVLMIEDRTTWQRVLGGLIEEAAASLCCRIQVEIACRFSEALDYLQATSFDCITVDNELPDGRMARLLLDRIAQSGRSVATIVVSGTANPQDVRDFFQEYGVKEFFWKNAFNPRLFRETLARLLMSER